MVSDENAHHYWHHGHGSFDVHDIAVGIDSYDASPSLLLLAKMALD